MKKKYLFLFAAILAGGLIFLSKATLAEYVPMEPIPGTEGTEAISSFPAYVNAVYKFLVWSVGIAAMFMISIGGFMYFTAAGNTSKMESGKRVIVDAIWGLVAVMVAWIILNTINPNLTNINLQSVENLGGGGSGNTTPTPTQSQMPTDPTQIPTDPTQSQMPTTPAPTQSTPTVP